MILQWAVVTVESLAMITWADEQDPHHPRCQTRTPLEARLAIRRIEKCGAGGYGRVSQVSPCPTGHDGCLIDLYLLLAAKRSEAMYETIEVAARRPRYRQAIERRGCMDDIRSPSAAVWRPGGRCNVQRRIGKRTHDA